MVPVLCPQGELPYKKDRVLVVYFTWLKKAVLVPFKVFSLERSTAEVFPVPFKVASQTKISLKITDNHSSIFF